MREKSLNEDGRALPHSERAGETTLGTGERARVYRALRDLTCSRCAGVIRAGELFTRGAGRVGGLPLVRSCRACVPFKTGGELLGALLAASEEGTAASPVSGGAKEKALSRLGRALAVSRERRARPSSKD